MPLARSSLIAASLLAAWGQAPADGQEIVVTARARPWRAVLIAEAGNAMHCRIIRSTGDAALDARGCAAMQACFDTARPGFVTRTGETSRARRTRLMAVNRDLQTCFRAVHTRIGVEPLGE